MRSDFKQKMDKSYSILNATSNSTHKSNAISSAANDNTEGEGKSESEGEIATLPEVKTPKMYKVLLLNDDFTPMDFVVLVLKRFFGKNEEEAIRIMLNVHQSGSGLAGVFSLEIAEMKVMQCNQFARLNQYPLKSIMEES